MGGAIRSLDTSTTDASQKMIIFAAMHYPLHVTQAFVWQEWNKSVFSCICICRSLTLCRGQTEEDDNMFHFFGMRHYFFPNFSSNSHTHSTPVYTTLLSLCLPSAFHWLSALGRASAHAIHGGGDGPCALEGRGGCKDLATMTTSDVAMCERVCATMIRNLPTQRFQQNINNRRHQLRSCMHMHMHIHIHVRTHR